MHRGVMHVPADHTVGLMLGRERRDIAFEGTEIIDAPLETVPGPLRERPARQPQREAQAVPCIAQHEQTGIQPPADRSDRMGDMRNLVEMVAMHHNITASIRCDMDGENSTTSIPAKCTPG